MPASPPSSWACTVREVRTMRRALGVPLLGRHLWPRRLSGGLGRLGAALALLGVVGDGGLRSRFGLLSSLGHLGGLRLGGLGLFDGLGLFGLGRFWGLF